MGLMDKFKNLFTDEEVVEEDEEETVEIKEIKKEEEPKLPTFMREKLAEEENEHGEKSHVMKIESDVEIKKEIKLEKNIEDEALEAKEIDHKQSFKFPIDFNDGDFTETRTSRQELRAKEKNNDFGFSKERYSHDEEMKEKTIHQTNKKDLKVSELYKDKKDDSKKNEKKFRATPIISPIYGVLDKNYIPDEVESNKGRNFEENRPSKNIDFDSVRKKAYGDLADEIKENLVCENCEYLKEVKDCKKKNMNENSEYANNNIKDFDYEDSEYQNITLDEAAENYYDYGVEYEKKPINHYDVDSVNSYYLDEEDGARVVDYSDSVEEKSKKEIPPVKSSINLLSTLKKSMGDDTESDASSKKDKNLELTDDLFNLIDSMYDERNDVND